MVSFFVDISVKAVVDRDDKHVAVNSKADRSEEHTSELQSR